MENVELVRIMHISDFPKAGKGILANQVLEKIGCLTESQVNFLSRKFKRGFFFPKSGPEFTL